MKKETKKIIEKLLLLPHPEGGYFREAYRSKGEIPQSSLPSEYDGNRNYSTAIYYLLTPNDISVFHRLHQDEIWHFYDGLALKIHIIGENGDYKTVKMGIDFENDEVPQYVVPGGSYFAVEVITNENCPKGYSLSGCTVAPGFNFSDFEIVSKETLLNKFPQHSETIAKFAK